LIVYDAIPVNQNITYDLHFGGNLVSFPFTGCYDVEDVILSEAQQYITKIIGEGVSLISSPVFGWIGNLDQFCGGEGYWMITNEDILFQYIISTQTIIIKENGNKQ